MEGVEVWCRATLEVGSACVKLLVKFVKMEVERREKSWGG